MKPPRHQTPRNRLADQIGLFHRCPCGKIGYGSRAIAKRHLRKLTGALRYEGDVYWCRAGKAWHVGSRRAGQSGA